MSSGIVGKLLKNPKGAYYTFITDETTDEKLYYLLRNGQETIIIEGKKVVYEPDTNWKGQGSRAAKNVRLFGEGIPQSQNRAANIQRTETATNAAYYLPKDTSDLLFGSSGVTLDNTALKIQKYIRVFREKEKKLKILSAQPYSIEEKGLLTKLTKSQLDVLSVYKYSHCVTGTLGSRMVVGLGGGSVFETAITLHHTYGLPYIPGSAVKGCLRSFIIRCLFADIVKAAKDDKEIEQTILNRKEHKEKDFVDFIELFGSQGQSGGVVFFDAFPAKCDKLELDIMNPHYADYYQGKTAPTDDMNPTPIKFYAVPENTQFTFRLASSKVDIKHTSIKGFPLTKLFEEMLSEIGIGAKTAVGYGWFNNIEEDKYGKA